MCAIANNTCTNEVLAFFHCIVPPYVMYIRHSNIIQRVNIHGGELTNIYSGGQPRGLAFDYR